MMNNDVWSHAFRETKTLIASDLHIHPHKKSNERLQDCLKVLEWIFETAKEKKIKNILFLGDLLHDRQKIDVYTYQKTFEVFEKYQSSEFSIYLLLGNHDLWYFDKWDISSVMPFRAIPNVNVINKPCTLEIAGHEVSFLPFTHNPLEDLNNLKKTRLLCAHLAIDGSFLNSFGSIADVSVEHDGDMVKIGPESLSEFDQVFLGHYHKEQRVTKTVEYVGSPLQLSFGEANCEKHIIVFDLETHEKEYIVNTFSPKHLILKYDEIDKFDLSKNFIQVLVDETTSSEIVELTKKLTENYDLGGLEIKPIRKETGDIVLDAKAIMLKEDEMISSYVNAVKESLGKLDRDRVTSIGEVIRRFDGDDFKILETIRNLNAKDSES